MSSIVKLGMWGKEKGDRLLRTFADKEIGAIAMETYRSP